LSEAGGSLRSNSVISVVGTGLSAALSMLYVSLGARWLGPAEYGSVGALVSISNVLQLTLGPLEAGLTLRVASLLGEQRLAELARFARASLRALTIGAGLLLAAWCLGAWALGDALGSYPLGGVVWLGVVSLSALAACLPRAVLRGRERFYDLSQNAVLESGLRLFLGLALIKLTTSASAMVAGYGLAGLVALAHGALVMRRGLPDAAPGVRAELELLSPFRALTAPLMLVHAYAALMVNLDVLVAKHYLSPREAGLYAGASSLSRVVAVAATPLLLVLFSRLAALSAARHNTRATLRGGALLIGLGLFSSLLVPALFGESLLGLVLGADYEGAERVLLYQWASVCMVTLHTFFADAMLATSRLRGPIVLLAPALALLVGFALHHDSALAIAQVTLAVVGVAGSLALFLLYRLREPLHVLTSAHDL
jgi:O-antigen/teichoic acid export membrane protein